MRISDWSSDVCSSDLRVSAGVEPLAYTTLVVGLADPPRRRQYGMNMIENQKIRPAQVIGQPGEPMTLDSLRSEERRVGKECVSQCRSWLEQIHYKKITYTQYR